MKKQVLIMGFVIASMMPISCSNGSTTGSITNDTGHKAMLETQQATKKDKDEKQPGTIRLTKDEFLKKVVNYEENASEWKYLGDKPAIIDFYADWCGPCRKIAPILEELAKEYDGKIYIYKINTDQEQDLAKAFGIRSIPSILFVPMDGVPQLAQGALPKDVMKKAIEEVLLVK